MALISLDEPQGNLIDLDAPTPVSKEPPGLVARLRQGYKSTVSAAKIGVTSDAEDIARLVAEDARTQLPQTEVQRQLAEEIKPYQQAAASAEGTWDSVTAWSSLAAKRLAQLATNPREALGMIAESLPNSAPGMAGTLAGGVAGAATPVPGGSLAGAVLGGTGGGFLIERGFALKDQILKEAQARGINPGDSAALVPIIKENYERFLEAANLKGVGTAATDAVLNRLTLGIAAAPEKAAVKDARGIVQGVKDGALTTEQGAARIAALEADQAARNTLGNKVKRGAAITAAEMGGEATSEAVGQKLAYGQVDPLEVVDEGLLAVGQGGVIAAGRGLVAKPLGLSSTSDVDRSIAAANAEIAKIGEARTVQQAIEAATAASGRLEDFTDKSLTPAVDAYLGRPPATTTTPAVAPVATQPETDEQRIARLRDAVDEHTRLQLQADQQANATNRDVALSTMRAQLAAELPGRGASEVDVNALPKVDTAAMLAKEEQRRAARAAAPALATPGVLEELPPLKQQTVLDERPLDVRAARNRLTVLRDQLAQQGGDPQSITTARHPTAPGKFIVVSTDPQFRYNPAAQGNIALGQDVGVGVRSTDVNPVRAYVQAKRQEPTQQARAFVQAYDAGQITDADVAAILARDQAAANSPLPLTYNADGTPAVTSVEDRKARGQSTAREREIGSSFVAPPPPITTPGPQTETPTTPEGGTPPELPPGESRPPVTSQGEFDRRMPVNANNPQVKRANLEGDFKSAATALAKSPNPIIRRVGELADKTLVGIVRLRKSPTKIDGSENILGMYRGRPDTVEVVRSHAADEWVTAHEITHALTARAMRYPTAKQKPIVAKMEALYKHVQKSLHAQGYRAGVSGGKELYGLTNVREFVAEAMSNQKFQYLLMQIPYKRISAWTAFVQTVAQLLGFNNHNALSEIILLTEKLSDMGRQNNRLPLTRAAPDDSLAAPPVKQSADRAAEPTAPPTREQLMAARVLPEALSNKATPGRISRGQFALVQQLARVFGKNVVLFDGVTKATGMVFPDDASTIYLNANSRQAHLAVFGHELMHLLKQDSPEAYDAIVKVMKLTATGAEEFKAYYKAEAQDHTEELVSDLLGNRMLETDFWNKVFKEIVTQHGKTEGKSILVRLGAAIMRAVNLAVKALNGQKGFDTDKYVANLEEVSAAMQKALAQYAITQRQVATELDKQPVDAALPNVSYTKQQLSADLPAAQARVSDLEELLRCVS